MTDNSATVHAANQRRQHSYTKEQLIACGEGTLFEPGSPRLPVGQMLMFDRIARISAEGGAYGAGEIRAELDIDPSLWFFACHFIGDPVMPGCLGLDAMWQLLGFHLGWRGHLGHGRALGVDEVRFTGQVLPNIKLVEYQIDIKRLIERKLVMIVGDAALIADGQKIYSATGLRVGLFNAPAVS